MRPTIPLAQWRLAIDLAATHAVNRIDARPAPQCGDCADCRLWASDHALALPPRLATELGRLGLDLAHPSDVYLSSEPGAKPVVMRVTYHVVGRILSGPAEFRHHELSGRGRLYVPHPDAPRDVGVAVMYQDRSHRPEWAPADLDDLLAIDLWLTVPQRAPERRARADGTPALERS